MIFLEFYILSFISFDKNVVPFEDTAVDRQIPPFTAIVISPRNNETSFSLPYVGK